MRRVSLIGSALLLATQAAAGNGVQPFEATFGVEWRGMSAGTSTLHLERIGDNSYRYTSRNVARGIFKLALPGAVTQSSDFRIVDGRVAPISYRADDGTGETNRDVTLEFDWDGGKVTGTAEDKPVDQPLTRGTQDSLSVQVALMCALAAGEAPASFSLIDKDEVKTYQYSRAGEESLETPLGKLDTVIYQSQREGSTRLTRLWLAPSLGYLPVRAQQLRKGKPEFTMTLRELQRQ